MPEPIGPVRLATIRNNYTHIQREAQADPMRRLEADNADVGDLLGEVDRLRSIHGHDFTNTWKGPVTCVCGVTYMDWLEGRKNQRAEAMQWRDISTLDAIDRAAEAEAELADLTAPTEWGAAGVQWTIGVRQPDGSVVIDTRGPDPDDEVAVRTAFADMQDTNGYRKVLLRRERTAWHEWETEERS